jgi:uncharacterized protein YcaQ
VASISTAVARRLAIQRQGLDGRWRLPKGKEGAAQAVERLGYVQIDTIAVVERAHHHTLWARCPDYAPQMLHELQAVDRRVFEYWANAASYVPISDYRYYVPRMRAAAGRTHAWYVSAEGRRIREHVLNRIRDEGPLGSADFKAPEGRKRGSWWDWKPAKQALEWLFEMGELMITERHNFQRIYDLTERVLPSDVDTIAPPATEVARFVVRRVLGTWGVAPVAEVRWGWRRQAGIREAVAELVAADEVTPVRIREMNEDWLALTEVLEEAPRRRSSRRLHILSPFDSMVMRRGHLASLFGFDCRLECYQPAEKRRWGYFCLPILWGEEFVGRLDAKADRRAKTLVVRKLIFEPDFADMEQVLEPLAMKLRAFASFNACARVRIEQAEPRKVKAPLSRWLRQVS